MTDAPVQQIGAGDVAVPVERRLADGWARALHGTSYPAMGLRPLRPLLDDLARRVLHELRADRPDPGAVARIGADLVAAHFTEPGVLTRVLDVLRAELGPHARAPAAVDRLLQVHALLATGYADAHADRIRAEHELITEAVFAARADAERARWSSEARWSTVLDTAPVGIGVADIAGPILEVNRTLCAMFGLTPAEFTRRSFRDFVEPGREPEHVAILDRMVAGEQDRARMPKSFRHASGRTFHTELALSLVRTPDGRPRFLVGLVVDLGERQAMEDRLRHQAEHDPLTGLPNRTVFYERLETALAEPGDVGVCFLDLDGFKGVNDTLGHGVGDELLTRLAHRLDAALSADGHLVARVGGDEFVVLVRGDHAARRHAAERALAAVTAPVHIDVRPGRPEPTRPRTAQPHTVRISTGIGVVGTDDPGAPRTSAELMKAADITLRWAKDDGAHEDGRAGYAVFDAERHRAHVERSTRSARMPDALAAGEFTVLYQPLVRLADRRTVGVEALVRWHCDGQLLGPDEFVPLAERSGLIVPLGRWVLEQALAQGVAWRRAGVPVLLSVNIAARQVREPGLVDDVARLLAHHDWPAAALQLELTESDAMATAGAPLDVLHRLAGLGVRIAIDDFGTGYSNLAYLRDLPVHVLKLAGPFVTGRAVGHGVAADETDAAVLAHVVRLAHTLGLTVVAEHVESAAHEQRLRDLGCDIGQGYLYGPPTDADSIEQRVSTEGAAR